MGQIDPLDFLQVDRQLTDGERAIRDRVRAFVDEHVLPEHRGMVRARGVPGRALQGFRRPRGAGHEPGRLRVRRRHRPWSTGSPTVRSSTGTRGSGPSSASRVRWRCSRSTATAARNRSRNGCRAWPPVRRSGASRSPSPGRGPIPSSMTTTACRDGSDWVLNGHKKWNTNGWASHVAVVWAKDEAGVVRGFVVPLGRVRGRVPRAGARVVVACRRPLRALPARRSAAGRRRPAGRGGHEGAALVPHRSQVRHRLGHRRRGTRVLRGGPGSCEGAGAVRQAHRLVPARAGQAVRDGVGAERGLAAGAAPRTHEGRGHGDARADQPGQAQQLACGLANGAGSAGAAGCHRHHVRCCRHPSHEQPGVGDHLRGHRGDPHAHRRAPPSPAFARSSERRPRSRSSLGSTTTHRRRHR